MTSYQHLPHDTYFDSFPGPASPPPPPTPGFPVEPIHPLASGPRITFGILLALASGFVGCGWAAFTLLLLALQSDAGGGWGSFGVPMGLAGLVIALSGIGGIGTAATARRPIGGLWVRIWLGMSCVFGGLTAAMVIAVIVLLHVNH